MLDIALEKLPTDEAGDVRILLCVVPLPPCGSQGRKVLRWNSDKHVTVTEAEAAADPQV